MTYQKDGPGTLRRLYFDRIVSPEQLRNLISERLENVNPLKCKCGEMIATPYMYQKENRKAFKIYQDAIIVKMIRKADV